MAKPSSFLLMILTSQTGHLNTNMAKDPDRVVPNGELEARHLGPLLVYPLPFEDL